MNAISTGGVMAMRNAILQKNQALRDVLGPQNGAGGIEGLAGGVQSPGGTQGADFTQALKSAFNEVNALQAKSGDAATAFERGETTDIAAVMLAKQEASVAFEATMQVRNKLLSAYKDIMSMPV